MHEQRGERANCFLLIRMTLHTAARLIKTIGRGVELPVPLPFHLTPPEGDKVNEGR